MRSPTSSTTAACARCTSLIPTGSRFEASWWVHDPTGRPVDYTDQGQFGDGDPVPAVRELQAADTLTSTPSTRLA